MTAQDRATIIKSQYYHIVPDAPGQADDDEQCAKSAELVSVSPPGDTYMIELYNFNIKCSSSTARNIQA